MDHKELNIKLNKALIIVSVLVIFGAIANFLFEQTHTTLSITHFIFTSFVYIVVGINSYVFLKRNKQNK